MKYKVLYDTQIAGKFVAKGEMMEFQSGTDIFFINRLLTNKVIEEAKEVKEPQKNKNDEVKESPKAKK